MSTALHPDRGAQKWRSDAPATAATFDDLAYWQAANYLTVGQLYLRANPLLREPLRADHLKLAPAGPWSLSAAANLVYTQLNRLARNRLAPTMLVVGPPEATPAALANLWLEGTYSERVPSLARDANGMAELFRRYGTPGGVPLELGAHVPFDTGQAGWRSGIVGARFALLSATGAAQGARRLLAACLLSESQAEAMLLHLASDPVRSLVPGRDGVVLPIILLRSSLAPPATGLRPGYLASLLCEHGYDPRVVSGDDPLVLHAGLGAALLEVQGRIDGAYDAVTSNRSTQSGSSPAIVVVSSGAFELPVGESGDRSLAEAASPTGILLGQARERPEQLSTLEEWLLGYSPDEVFDVDGAPNPRLDALLPPGPLRLGQLGRKLADRT